MNGMSQKAVKVQLVRSLISTREDHRVTVRGLGLRRMNSVSELQDMSAMRGMINKVSYSVRVTGQSKAEKNMQLNNLKPAASSRHAEYHIGHGTGSGLGKTADRGRKGQKSCSGSFHKVGSEGGQMPLHRRLPKRGSTSLTKELTAGMRLGDLAGLPIEETDLLPLKQAGPVGEMVKSAKVILSGGIDRKVTLKGISTTVGAKAATEAAGGSLA